MRSGVQSLCGFSLLKGKEYVGCNSIVIVVNNAVCGCGFGCSRLSGSRGSYCLENKLPRGLLFNSFPVYRKFRSGLRKRLRIRMHKVCFVNHLTVLSQKNYFSNIFFR